MASDAESFVDNKPTYITDNEAFVMAKIMAASLDGMDTVWLAEKMHDTTIQDGGASPDVSGGQIRSSKKP